MSTVHRRVETRIIVNGGTIERRATFSILSSVSKDKRPDVTLVEFDDDRKGRRQRDEKDRRDIDGQSVEGIERITRFRF